MRTRVFKDFNGIYKDAHDKSTVIEKPSKYINEEILPHSPSSNKGIAPSIKQSTTPLRVGQTPLKKEEDSTDTIFPVKQTKTAKSQQTLKESFRKDIERLSKNIYNKLEGRQEEKPKKSDSSMEW